MKLSHRIAYFLASKFDVNTSLMRTAISEKLLNIPGMLTPNERRFLQNYCRYVYSGQGHIVDLGCWMGSSALSLAEGLSQSKKKISGNRRIFAYDLFLWEAWMDDCQKYMPPLTKKYKPGDSFQEEFESYAGEYDNLIVRAQDLAQVIWQEGHIEFLFVDAMKTPQLALAIQRQFFPKVLGGKGVIVHQDFVHYYTYWIHILTYRLRNYLTLLYDIKDSASTAFLCKKKIPQDIVEADNFELESLCEDEIEDAFAYSISLINPALSHRVLSAKALLYHHQGYREKAEKVLNDEISSVQRSDGEVAAVYKMVSRHH